MSKEKNHQEKIELHPRNKNRDRYNLHEMVLALPALKSFITKNKKGEDSINFSAARAVKMLNKAILNYYYRIKFWEFPDDNLCPPIPGRADYIHYVADLLAESNKNKIPTGSQVVCLDIGTGASCIYPIIGVAEYQWNFIASDVNPESLSSAEKIESSNPILKGKIDFRIQKNPKLIFENIIRNGERIDVSICNPPFHASLAEARKGTERKLKNLKLNKQHKIDRNFSGARNELVYPGGEYQFIANMISESEKFAKSCQWFTSLVSKATNEKRLKKLLEKTAATEVRTIQTKTGNKTGRILAWTFLGAENREPRAEI